MKVHVFWIVMLCHWLRVSDILKVPDTFIIRVKQCLTLMMNPAVFQNVRNHLKLLAW